MKKRFIIGLFIVILSLGYIVKADAPTITEAPGGTSETIPSEAFETFPGLTLGDIKSDGGVTTIPDPSGHTNLQIVGKEVVGERHVSIPAQHDQNGNPIPFNPDSLLLGSNALNDMTKSNNYLSGAWKDNMDTSNTTNMDLKNVVYNPKTKSYELTVGFRQPISELTNDSRQLNVALKVKSIADTPRFKGASYEKQKEIIFDMLKMDPSNAFFQHTINQFFVMGHFSKNLDELIASLLKTFNINAPVKYVYPPIVVKNAPPAPGQGACEQWNRVPQPGPVSCLGAGTKQGKRAKCNVNKTEEFMSSYTTTTPNNSDPWRRNEQPFCEDQRDGYLPFSEIMNPFGHRTWSKNDLVQNGLNQFLRKRNTNTFVNNPWKSSWRGESRSWNPFSRNNRLSGIPYQIEWSPLLDSWTDKEHNINPIITDSIRERDKAEKANLAFARSYGFNNPLKVYNEAPNPKMRVTALNLDTNTWDVGDTTNLFCMGQYDLKIEPRYDIHRWDRYRLFDHHKTESKSWEYKCVDTTDCKTWGEKCTESEPSEYDDNGKLISLGRCIKREKYCEVYKTKGKEVNLGGVNTKYPKGTTTKGSFDAGSIPPVYKQRRKYQYRIGGMIEYHSITANTGNPRFRPIPNSYSDPTKIKAGYGFGYTTGMKVITDYDNDPRTYNVSPVIIRPNKAVPLNIRTNNYLRSIGRFDPNVRYNRANNAPSKSSSVDRNFIEEDLTGRMTRTTFVPSRISNADRVDNIEHTTPIRDILPASSNVRKTPINWNNMSTSFTMNSDPNKYYHAYWRTKGEPNLIPAYKPGPLHYIFLDYRSGTDYNVASVDLIRLNNNGFDASAFNSGSIRVIGNMWEDSFSRPDYKEAEE